ncbi:MAG: hypothetical protein K0A95_06750 [Chromatiales bacterium]|nr:hypothetical protein [Gammaproteobacteria bacterium]MBW6476753.1 hypothetical protein [Chromatiales bacterium]
MFTRHDELPVYAYRQSSVDAAFYNHVQLAFNRLGKELRLHIPGLKTLDLILQADAWIIVDQAFNDMPVAAWADFDRSGRAGLHQPVPCRLRLFHAHADLILQRTLEAMDEQLLQQLDTSGDQHKVLRFPEKKPEQD